MLCCRAGAGNGSPPRAGPAEGGRGNQGILGWFEVGKSSWAGRFHRARWLRVTSRASPWLSHLHVPSFWDGQAPFRTHPHTPKVLGAAQVLQISEQTRAQERGHGRWHRGTSVSPTPATVVSPMGPALARCGHFRPIPREFQPCFGTNPRAVGMPGAGQTRDPSRGRNVEVSGQQSVFVPLTATGMKLPHPPLAPKLMERPPNPMGKAR